MAVIKYKYAYYKVVGGAMLLKYASVENFMGCHNTEGISTSTDFMSKVLRISKPFGFLPAKTPFTIKYVVSASATSSADDSNDTDSDKNEQ